VPEHSDRTSAVALVIVSGAVMVWAGRLWVTSGVNTALLVSIVPGFTIEAAYARHRRIDRRAGWSPPSGRRRLAQEAVGLAAGAVMAAGGYAGTRWGWTSSLPAFVVGLALIGTTPVLGRSRVRASNEPEDVSVHPGRYTAEYPEDFVVFLIGARMNHPLKIHKWLPVALAMPRMLKVLDDHPELGCLGYQQWYGRTTGMVQYWRDFASLDRFARDTDLPHLEPWRRFNKAVRDSGDVGVWHETFRVHAGEYEAIYGNMPVFGLAAATSHVPVAAKGQSAALRIGASRTDEVAVPPY
jgi:hypothetical protein